MNTTQLLNRRSFFKYAAASASSVAGASAFWGIAKRVHAVPLDFFNLGIIADEVDQDLEKGLLFVREFGLRWVELRNIWKTYVTDIDDQTAQKAKQLIEKYNIRISVIDTAFLKCKLPGTTLVKDYKDSYPYEEQYNMLKRACERAVFFSAPYVRIFTFWRVADPISIMDEIVHHLKRAIDIAAPLGVSLVIENEYSCNIGTGAESAMLLSRLIHPNIGLAWDPGNAIAAGETPYPDGYNTLDKARIMHVHIKDYDASAHKVVKVGTGNVDYPNQFRALLKDGFRGTLSLETHYKIDGSGEMSSRESMQSIIEIIKNI